MAKQLMKSNPDEQDLALMAALITLTADRHDFLSDVERKMICSLQVNILVEI